LSAAGGEAESEHGARRPSGPSRLRPEQHDQALQAEYLHLQKTIEDFDGRALTIKAWSISFSMASIAGALAGGSHAILLVAGASAILFWLLEAGWKAFQYVYYRRAHAI